jgi:hypothetical protein
VITVDANILLYAIDEHSPMNTVSRTWWEQTLSSSETIALDWNVLLAFVRISTRANVFLKPLKVDEAMGLLDSWLSLSNVTVLSPTDRHVFVLRELLKPLGTAGNLTSDAHLAALAIEHGATLYSFDSDFARFTGLRWANPTNL